MPKQRREWKLYNEDIENTFTQHQTQITQLDSSISLQASTITSLDGKVENYYSELTVADTGIRTEVATKVGKDTIISTINQSPESVTINASKVNLNGYVTMTNLSTSGQTTINGSNITTGTIAAARLAISDYAKFTDLSTAGGTTINGANITTGSITAEKLNVSDLQALGATIGGFTIDTTSIRSGALNSTAAGAVALSTTNFSRSIGGTTRSNLRLAIGQSFGVNSSGDVYATGNVTVGSLTTTDTVSNTGAYANLTKYDKLVRLSIPCANMQSLALDLRDMSGTALKVPNSHAPSQTVWAPFTWNNGSGAYKLGTAKITTAGNIEFYCYGSYGGGQINISGSNYTSYTAYTICMNTEWFI